MQYNEYLFEKLAIYTRFRAICCKMWCNMLLNAVRFAAKRSAFWC